VQNEQGVAALVVILCGRYESIKPEISGHTNCLKQCRPTVILFPRSHFFLHFLSLSIVSHFSHSTAVSWFFD